MLVLISNTTRCKRLTLGRMSAQQLLASLLSRKEKSWWWVVGHMTGEMEVETTVEDHMGEEDHLELPWSSHPRTWWSALVISSRFPVEELARWCGAGRVLPSHPLPVRPVESSQSPMQTLLTPVSMFVEAVTESPDRLESLCRALELRHK